MIKIEKIPSVNTYSVRISVLRNGKEMKTCAFNGDDLPTTAHFRLYFDDFLIGIVSVFKSNCTFFNHLDQYQIRGMAVIDSYQNRGFGKLLIQRAENHVNSLNADLIWMNARETAVAFYLKLGYETVGNAFIIDGIGNHYLMIKKI